MAAVAGLLDSFDRWAASSRQGIRCSALVGPSPSRCGNLHSELQAVEALLLASKTTQVCCTCRQRKLRQQGIGHMLRDSPQYSGPHSMAEPWNKDADMFQQSIVGVVYAMQCGRPRAM